MTDLNKPVWRKTNEYKREAGKLRRVMVGMMPAGFIALRLERCRRIETLPVLAILDMAIKSRVAYERAQKRKQKGKQ